MLALTPDAFRRYSLALPAFRSRLNNEIELKAITSVKEAKTIADFYVEEGRKQSDTRLAASPGIEQPVSDKDIESVFQQLLQSDSDGVNHRDFLQKLHDLAEVSMSQFPAISPM